MLVKGGARCPKHLHIERKQHDARRGTAHERGYTSAWRKARESFLRSHPLCKQCSAEGFTQLGAVVDHVVPHRGDQKLFWDSTNWQTLCKPHHDRKTAREDGGFGHRRARPAEG